MGREGLGGGEKEGEGNRRGSECRVQEGEIKEIKVGEKGNNREVE